MKRLIVVLALMSVSLPAFGGSHVETLVGSFRVPYTHGFVNTARVMTAKIARAMVGTKCDGLTLGNTCRSVPVYAMRIRVGIAYVAPGSPDLQLTANVDIDPAEVDISTLLRIVEGKDAADLFAVESSMGTERALVVEDANPVDCQPDQPDCTTGVTYKTVEVPAMTLYVLLR